MEKWREKFLCNLLQWEQQTKCESLHVGMNLLTLLNTALQAPQHVPMNKRDEAVRKAMGLIDPLVLTEVQMKRTEELFYNAIRDAHAQWRKHSRRLHKFYEKCLHPAPAATVNATPTANVTGIVLASTAVGWSPHLQQFGQLVLMMPAGLPAGP